MRTMSLIPAARSFWRNRSSDRVQPFAMARKLAVQMYWMMRKAWDYEQLKKFGSHAEQLGHRYGVQ
jgi:hypothetical protein